MEKNYRGLLMKYLKKYNESYYNDKIRTEMSDILCDLEDDGYQLTVCKTGTTGSDCFLEISEKDIIDIWIGKGTTKDRTSGLSFAWNDIKPVIDHLKSYLSNKYYISSIKAVFNDGSYYGEHDNIDPEVSRHQYSSVTVSFSPLVKPIPLRMKTLKTFEFWNPFKRKSDPIQLTTELLIYLLSSDLDDHTYKLIECYFKSDGIKPKLDRADIIGDLPGVRDLRSAYHRKDFKKGICLLDPHFHQGDIFTIEKSINRKRLRSYGIDFIPTNAGAYTVLLFYTI